MSSFVQPFSPRYTIKDSETSLEITKSISKLQKGFLVGVAIFGSIIWIAAGIAIAYLMVQAAIPPFRVPASMYILPVEWFLGSVVLLLMFLWRFTNKEIIQVSDQEITISLQSRMFNRSRHYSAKDIKDLRVSAYAQKSIAFDYGARTIRFGWGLDEAEAKQIIAAVQKKFAVYSL